MSAVYIHIPYCVRKCLYCDFCSVPKDDSAGEYASAVAREIELRTKKLKAKERCQTVFFGGGTPSILPAEDLITMLDVVRAAFEMDDDAEISLECNPATANLAELIRLKEAGFNRISIGLQSADDGLLKTVGRAHSCADFLKCFMDAREAGFENINVDVMHGLPNQTMEQYADTLRKVCDLDPEHISSYALILEEGTPLFRMERACEITLPTEDETYDMQDYGLSYLPERGYSRYEVSNFAKPGYECRHNLVYWDNKPYWGFGVAAHSSMPKDGAWQRSANTEDINAYLRKLRRGKLPTEDEITLFASEESFECVMLGLRKVEGMNKADFETRFGVSIAQAFPKAFAEVESCGWWSETDTHLALTPKGMDMLNTVLTLFR